MGCCGLLWVVVGCCVLVRVFPAVGVIVTAIQIPSLSFRLQGGNANPSKHPASLQNGNCRNTQGRSPTATAFGSTGHVHAEIPLRTSQFARPRTRGRSVEEAFCAIYRRRKLPAWSLKDAKTRFRAKGNYPPQVDAFRLFGDEKVGAKCEPREGQLPILSRTRWQAGKAVFRMRCL